MKLALIEGIFIVVNRDFKAVALTLVKAAIFAELRDTRLTFRRSIISFSKLLLVVFILLLLLLLCLNLYLEVVFKGKLIIFLLLFEWVILLFRFSSALIKRTDSALD